MPCILSWENAVSMSYPCKIQRSKRFGTHVRTSSAWTGTGGDGASEVPTHPSVSYSGFQSQGHCPSFPSFFSKAKITFLFLSDDRRSTIIRSSASENNKNCSKSHCPKADCLLPSCQTQYPHPNTHTHTQTSPAERLLTCLHIRVSWAALNR